MKKVLSLVLVTMMITSTTFATTSGIAADASHIQMITRTFDQFRYQMTVAGDPSNSAFQAKATADFKQQIADLQSKGVSPDELMSYVRSNILDASVRADFDRLLASMDADQISSEEAGNLAMQFMAKKYQAGASYSGGTGSYSGVMMALGVIVVGVITFIVIKHIKNQTSTKTETQTNTRTRTDTVTNTDTVTITNTDTSTGNCYYNYDTYQYCCD